MGEGVITCAQTRKARLAELLVAEAAVAIMAPAPAANGPRWMHEFLPSLVTSIQTKPRAPAPQRLEPVLRMPHPISPPPTLPVCIVYEATAPRDRHRPCGGQGHG